jgi:hypothetical protein
MGNWTLESLNGTSDPLNGATFGTNFRAHYKLKYTPTMFDKFVETPRLDWHEKIHMKEHHKNEWWEFETNMYTHNPASVTLLVWPRRYVEAYHTAAGIPSGVNMKGSSKLLDKRGSPVPIKDLGLNITDAGKKADAVRNYLKKHGGYLSIEIHDIPSINIPTGNEHKERLLVFNCGVVGGGLRLKAEQYLNVDAAQPQATWGRRFNMTWMESWSTLGFNKVQVPAGVGAPRTPAFMTGECW